MVRASARAFERLKQNCASAPAPGHGAVPALSSYDRSTGAGASLETGQTYLVAVCGNLLFVLAVEVLLDRRLGAVIVTDEDL